MSDSEHYVPPPPPYEHSLQHDQKIIEVQGLDSELSKGGPFRDEEKDSKYSRTLSDKIPRDVAIHTLRSARSVNANLRVPRPLPPSPADSRSRAQRSKFGPIAEVKSYAAQNDHAMEPHAPVPPPFSAIGPSLDEASYTQSMLHPGTSVHPSPFHYPSQPSYDTPRRGCDDRWLVSAYSPMEPSSFRRPSHMSSQLPSYSLPQNYDNRGTRLSFDPSVAYSGSQANTRPAQRGVAASLYSSAVSPHLRPDSAQVSGSRKYTPPRPAPWSTESLHLNKIDMRSARALPPSSTHPSSPTSLYTPRTRTRSGYEQRWATSESDIARDVYHG